MKQETKKYRCIKEHRHNGMYIVEGLLVNGTPESPSQYWELIEEPAIGITDTSSNEENKKSSCCGAEIKKVYDFVQYIDSCSLCCKYHDSPCKNHKYPLSISDGVLCTKCNKIVKGEPEEQKSVWQETSNDSYSGCKIGGDSTQLHSSLNIYPYGKPQEEKIELKPKEFLEKIEIYSEDLPKTITKEEALINMQFFRIMTPHRSADWEKTYDDMIQFIENSQQITPSIEWEEIEYLFRHFSFIRIPHCVGYFIEDYQALDFFKPHFTALQQDNDNLSKELHGWNMKYDSLFDEAEKYKQRAERAEKRVIELEEREAIRMIKSTPINRKILKKN